MRNPESFKKEEETGEEEGIEKLESFLSLSALELREKGVPVDNKMRVDTNSFESVYPKDAIERDKATVDGLKQKWHEKSVQEWGEESAEKMETEGKNLEMLKTAIFQKNLGEGFVAVRSSGYDDIKNGVDNLILEKKTGNIVCALDEVAGRGVESKENKVSEINKQDGASLKYGLKYEPEVSKSSGKREVKMALKLGKVENIPLFYLALPQKLIQEGIRNFNPSLSESSLAEQKIFQYFTQSMQVQLERTRGSVGGFRSQKVKERLNGFERVLREIEA